MIIIHGENTINSREKLQELIAQIKENNQTLIRFEAKELTYAQLEEALGTQDLFTTKKAYIIEGLHSLPKSEKQKGLIDLCKKNLDSMIILWEKRELTATMLKVFTNADTNIQIFVFKASKTLFSWLEMLGSKTQTTKKVELLHAAIKTDGEYFCFLMLIRQFRLLIQAKTQEKIGGPPFMLAKLQKQAAQFTLEELLQIHKNLLATDIAQKTSTNLLELKQELDLFTVKL